MFRNVLLLFLLLRIVFGEVFIRIYPPIDSAMGEYTVNAYNQSIYSVDDGYLIISLGAKYDECCTNLLLLKVDENGDTIWTREHWLADVRNPYDFGVTELIDRNFALFYGNVIFKFNQNGEILWVSDTIMDFLQFNGIIETIDGGFVLSFLTRSSDMDTFFIVRTDSLGNIVSIKSFPNYILPWGTPVWGTLPLYKLSDDEFIAVDGARLYKFNFDLDTLWVRTYDYWFVWVNDVFQLRNGNLLLCGTCPIMLEVSPDDGSVLRTGAVSVDTLYIRWVRPLYEKPNGDLILAAVLGIPGDLGGDSTACIVCVDSTWEPKWVEDIYDPRIEHLFFITPPLIEVNESTYIGVGPAKVPFDSTRICFIKLVHSDTTSEVMETTPANITFSTYPNPFNSSVVISAPVGSKISIYDINGQMVLPPKPMKGSHLEWKPSKTLPSGIYIVRVHLRQGATITGRIMYLK